MQKPLILVFTALCGLSFMTACPGENTGDAGPSDAGGEGEGEGEGEDLRAEGDTCDPARTDQCESGLICMPGQLNPAVGVCRVDCSSDENACPANRTCQDVLSANLDFLGSACIPQQPARDGACQAWTDPDACAEDRMCLLTSFEEDAAGNPVTTFNCKDTCDKDAADLDAACPGDERCFASPFIQGFQPNPANPQDVLPCTIDSCPGADCECDATNGFECTELTSGTACVFIPGQCGTPVPPVLAENLVPGGITQELVCNTVDDHAFCDDSMVSEESTSICLTGIFGASAPNDGICFPFCSSPTADYDGNGTISEEEQGELFECQAGWTCSDSTALALGVGVDIADGQDALACNPSNCTEGEPCPSECGEGDYQCVTFEGQTETVSICFAPYGACVPEEADAGPQPDAGPQVDAGQDTDAGAGQDDAGPDPVDEDAGSTDAG